VKTKEIKALADLTNQDCNKLDVRFATAEDGHGNEQGT